MMRGYGVPKHRRYFIHYYQESAAFCRLGFVRSSLVAGGGDGETDDMDEGKRTGGMLSRSGEADK
jgi:hypothetical protein